MMPRLETAVLVIVAIRTSLVHSQCLPAKDNGTGNFSVMRASSLLLLLIVAMLGLAVAAQTCSGTCYSGGDNDCSGCYCRGCAPFVCYSADDASIPAHERSQKDPQYKPK